jgi:hypothetical protein
MKPLSILMFTLTLTACGPAEPEVRTTDVSNQGTACIQDGAFIVDFDRCLSSSCDTLVGASCEANVDGDTVTVTSAGSIESLTGPDVSCTTDCGFARVECTLTGDLGGVTTIAYAGSETTDLDCAN